jgi:hypothetical protein
MSRAQTQRCFVPRATCCAVPCQLCTISRRGAVNDRVVPVQQLRQHNSLCFLIDMVGPRFLRCWSAVPSDAPHRIQRSLLQATSWLSLTSHPAGFPGARPYHMKSRRGEPCCLTYSSSTFSFRLGVYDSQTRFGLPPIRRPCVGCSTPSKDRRTTH